MDDYSNLFSLAGQHYGEDPLWLQAMAQQESGGDPNAVNSQTATGQPSLGLMQLQPGTAQEMGVTDPMDAAQNINGGAHYYVKNKQKYNDPNQALMAYNWGPGNVDRWIKNGANPEEIPAETKQYVANVNKNYQKLKSNSHVEITPMSSTQTQEMDPLDQRAAEADKIFLPSDNNNPAEEDPLEARAREADEPTTKSKVKSSVSALDDIADATPTAVARGVGAIPQIPAYAGNLAAQTEGYLYGKAHDLLSNTPLTPVQHTALQNIHPFTTGDNLSDQLVKTGAQLTQGLAGDNLNSAQKANLQKLQQEGISGNLLYEPQTTPGKLTTAGIEGMLGGSLPNGASITKGAGAIQNALSGVGAEAANEAYPNNPVAMIAGGMLAPGARGAGKMLSGQAIDPRIAKLAQTMDTQYGIKIPGYQLSNSPVIQRAGSMLERLGFTGSNDNPAKFNSAIADSIGAPKGETGLTPDVMKAAMDNNSAGYNQILNKIGSVKVSNIDTELNSILNKAKKTITTNKEASVSNLASAANEIMDAISPNDTISARDYKSLTSRNSTLNDLINNPDTAKHARLIEDTLHDALKNSAAPADVKTLNALDLKWKNMRTVEGLAKKTDATGQISPASLLTPVAKSFKDMAYNSAGDLGTLAKAGKTFKLTPSSGTFENTALGRAFSYIPETIAAGGLKLLGASFPQIATGVGTLWAGGKALGHTLSSDAYRNHLINNSLNPTPTMAPGNPLLNYGLPAVATVNPSK